MSNHERIFSQSLSGVPSQHFYVKFEQNVGNIKICATPLVSVRSSVA
jgi:hypothetical protein